MLGESSTKRSTRPHTNHLKLTKLAVFLHTASIAGWNRFVSPILLSSGFTPIQIGKIKLASQVAKIISQPIWGVLSDVYDPLNVITISTFLGAITLTRVRIAIDARNFTQLTTWRIVRSASTAASPALDALVLRLVENTSEGYGRQRLWGSVAWGLSSLFAGTIIDRFGEGSIFTYTYLTSGLLLVFFVMLGRILPRKGRVGQSPQKKETQDSSDGIRRRRRSRMCTTIKEASKSPNSIPIGIILMHSFIYGIIMILFDSILMLQLERDFGISRSVQGVFTAVSILSTLPVYHYSNEFKDRIGHVGMIQTSIIISVIRLCLTKVACSEIISDGSRANWLLLLQLFHGFHFAANWTASVELLDTLASRQLRSLMQFILNLAYFSAGNGVGNLWLSFVYEQQGGQAAYSRGLWLCSVDFLLILTLKRYNKRAAPMLMTGESSV